jgi:omega-amidase
MRFSARPLALLLSAASTSAFVVRPTFARSSLQLFSSSAVTTSKETKLMMAKVALCQFPVTDDKAVNHATASDYLRRAAKAGAQLAVLPEIWNSPYATSAFAEYAEILPSVGDDESSSTADSPSVQLLQQHAKDSNMWIVGGSIPENDNGKIYNTCLIFDPSGTLVAKHRKVHLFDIDVPGGITFKESDTLSAGEGMTAFDGGEAFGMIGVGIW